MKRREGPSVGIFTIGIAALFLVGFLLLVIFGAKTYRNTVESQTGNQESRAILSYLAAVVKGNDAEGAVSIRESEEGPLLIVRDGSGYALRIYCREGVLLEDYGKEEAPLDPEGAQIIGTCGQFLPEEVKEGVLVIQTGEGREILCLRSRGGVAP